MKKWKMKKHIPYGLYCYIVTGVDYNSTPMIKTKYCPYYKRLGNKIYEGEYKGKHYKESIPFYKCTYCNTNSEKEFLLSDQCKICGVHDYYEY